MCLFSGKKKKAKSTTKLSNSLLGTDHMIHSDGGEEIGQCQEHVDARLI